MVDPRANWLHITKPDSASCHYPPSVPQADTCLILLHIDYSAGGTGWMFVLLCYCNNILDGQDDQK